MFTLAALPFLCLVAVLGQDKLPFMGTCPNTYFLPDTFARNKVNRPLIGRCRKTISEGNTDLRPLSKVNDGIWQYIKVVKIEAYQKAEWFFVDFNFIDWKGSYYITTYIKYPGERPFPQTRKAVGEHEWTRSVLFWNDILANQTKIINYNINILKYQPGEWAFFYECTDDEFSAFGDIDIRYVLGQRPLTKEDEAEIKRIDKNNKFRGKLMTFKM